MANKKKTLKGKRYTPEEKEQILSFVRQYNSEHGRGGVTAATKQFGASALSISGWLKSGGESSSGTSKRKGAASSAQGRSKVLDQLATLDREIYARRKELAALEAKFEKLKGSL